MELVLGRKFDEALGLIDNMGGRSHPQPSETITLVPFLSKSPEPQLQLKQHSTFGDTFVSGSTLRQTSQTPAMSPIPCPIQLVQRLSRSGRGSEHLRVHIENSADMKVSDLASFIDDHSRPLTQSFVDGFFERLCCEASNRACSLTQKVWELMTRDDIISKVQFSRLIESFVNRRRSAEVVLVPLFISESEWVLVAAYFTGTVRVLCTPSLLPREVALQSIRKLVRLLRLSISSFVVEPVQLLPANSSFRQVLLLRSAVLLFGDLLPDIPADIEPFARAVVLFVLGQNFLFCSKS